MFVSSWSGSTGSRLSRPVYAQIEHRLTRASSAFANYARNLFAGNKRRKEIVQVRHASSESARRPDDDLTHSLYGRAKPKILAPILFTASVGIGSFGLAHYYRLHRAQIEQQWSQFQRTWLPFLDRSNKSEESFNGVYSVTPPKDGFLGFVDQTIAGAKARWQELSPGKAAVLSILSGSAALLLAWRIPSSTVRSFLARHFLHSAYSGKSYTLLTSAFFHIELWHFAFNAFAMWGFGDIAHFLLGREYFVATTVTAAATSSLTHHLWSALLRNRSAGLGASGFVCTFVALTAMVFPTAKSQLFFVIPVPMDKTLYGLVAFDMIGLTGLWTSLFGWHIAHAAHLGGVASGIALFYLLNANNRRDLRNQLPPEVVQLYDRYYNKIFYGR